MLLAATTTETTLTVIGCGVLGLVIGSFLTVVVDRVPRGASIVAPPSACGACGHRLTALDLVPVASWLVLRGRCRHCGTTIGVEPIVIELATAALFVVFAWHFGPSAELPAFLTLAAALVALTWIDLREQRLPREITYTTIAVGAPLLVVAALVLDEPERIWQMGLGAAIALAVIGGIHLVVPHGMGSGDVRLSPLLGLYLGWINPGIVPIGLFYGFLLGAVVGVALIAFGSAGRKTAVPFGPFLAAGTVLAVLTGQALIDTWWHG
jgi:leader peptidase (prepilin peptidase) / N-methyltransferase